MSIAEKLTRIAENEQRVYDAGYAKGKAEGGTGSMIGTWVINEEPSIANESSFYATVKGTFHHHDDTNFVESVLESIELWFDVENGLGYLELLGENNVTRYEYGWQSPIGSMYSEGDTTLLRTITLTEEPTDELLRAWLKANATFTPVEHPVVDPDKIIEATATGVGSVYLDDVSEVNHDVKIKTAAGAKVKTFVGKNLLSDAVYNVDNWVRVEGIDINAANSKCYFLDEIPNGTYTISAKSSVSSNYLYFYYSEDNGVTWEAYRGQNGTNYIIAGANSYTITFDKTSDIRLLIWLGNTYFHESIEYIQIEVGDTATEYEPYKEPIAYTADSNGVANGRSISPMMFIATDGSSEITVEYRKSWGMDYERDAFWRALQNGGELNNYAATFGAAWTPETFRPKYDIVPSNAYMMFRQSRMNIDLEEHLSALGVKLDFSKATEATYAFSSASFTRVGIVDLSGSTSGIPGDNIFNNCENLVTIDKIVIKSGSRGEFSNGCFMNCSSLENVTFEGLITTDINLQWSTRLSKKSIDNVMQCMQDGTSGSGNSGVVLTLSLAAVNKAYETSAGANDGSESESFLAWVNNVNYTITVV